MKRLLLSALLLCSVLLSAAQLSAQPKYVFYFIGDGMGLNITHAAELYKAEQSGSTNYMPQSLLFSTFPTIGIINTSSASHFITDSAAAGTALATGEKTTKGTIGLSSNHTSELTSVADRFKEKGRGVAILTTVSIDHATPAAFYGHNKSRNNYYDIALQGAVSNFDILGGSGFAGSKSESGKSVFPAYEKAGYTHLQGKKELPEMKSATGKILITERKGVNERALAPATDRTNDDLTLPELVESSIEYLYKNYAEKGFMIMAEAGQIDWCGHNNDVNGSICEVLDLEKAVEVAFEFYKRFPEETLIIVTADHETGGYGNGRNERGYDMDFSRIKNGIQSYYSYSNDVEKLIEKRVKFKKLPLPKGYNFNDKELEELKEEYEDIVLDGDKEGNFVDVVYDTINIAVGAGWTTRNHTGSPVMVYSIGKGRENFGGYYDNTMLPRKILKTTEI